MNVLVVPTIRESIYKFLQAWRSPIWDEIVIIEDNPNKTFDLHDVHHFSWKEIEEDLGNDAWIISRRDSAIRSYGFLKAYQLGAENIFTLDDDCYPTMSVESFVSKHIDNITNTPRWTETAGCRTRGIPYDNLGTLPNVVISVGLWTGVPDYDSIQMFSDNTTDFKPPSGNRIMPYGQYFPLCGMNFAHQSRATPLCYFPLMGEGYMYRRFDDIWFGIIAKKICDHLGWSISVGEPHIHHTKESNKFSNLEREASGIRANEDFWMTIDNIKLTETCPADCMAEIGESIQSNRGYKHRLGQALCIWAKLF